MSKTMEGRMTDQIEYRSVSIGDLDTRLEPTEDGTFAGYACRYGIEDSYHTTFRSGCFTEGGLDSGKYALLAMHDETRVLGTFQASEDDTGLWIEGRYDPTPDGLAARARALSGSAGELSVGFVRISDRKDPEITAARLVEVSAITARMASQPGAAITSVRSKDGEEPELTDTETHLIEEMEANQPDAEHPVVPEEVPEGTEEELQEKVDPGTPIEEDRAKARCVTCKRFVSKPLCSTCKPATRSNDGREVRATIEPPAGSYEFLISLVREVIEAWARDCYAAPADDATKWIYTCVHATWANRVVATVYGTGIEDDGDTWRFPYLIGDNEDVTLGSPVAVELVTVIQPAGEDYAQLSADEEVEGRNEGGEDQSEDDADLRLRRAAALRLMAS